MTGKGRKVRKIQPLEGDMITPNRLCRIDIICPRRIHDCRRTVELLLPIPLVKPTTVPKSVQVTSDVLLILSLPGVSHRHSSGFKSGDHASQFELRISSISKSHRIMKCSDVVHDE
ncbi:hypothetical protein TNCV_3498841 [Trichonephila clavipes]|nr:hypothetical protein TNCV_3498841 [Trichonephila clavipes]